MRAIVVGASILSILFSVQPAWADYPASQPTTQPAMGAPVETPPVADKPKAAAPLGLQLGQHVFVRPGLQYRPRFFAHGGKNFADGGGTTFYTHRARASLHVKAFTWYSAMVQLQDVRMWGSETNTLTDFSANGFDVHQAWLELKCHLGLALRVGRQEIAFDNHRLIGTVGWADQARAFDAIHLIYKSSFGLEANAFYAKVGDEDAFLQSKGAAGTKEDMDLAALRVRFAKIKFARPTLAVIYDHNGIKQQNRVTLGLFLDGAPIKGLKYSAEFYYQLGSLTAGGKDKDIAAMLVAGRVGYTAPLKLKPSITLWAEYISGDHTPGDDTVSTFDTLFATNHKFYGLMDLFLNLPVHTGGMGLMDIGGRVKVLPCKGLALFVDFHHFELAKEHPSTNTATFGNEVDVVAKYKFNKHVSAEVVFGAFMPKLGLSNLKKGGQDTELFSYTQLDFKL